MGSQKTPSLTFQVDDIEMLQNEYSLLKLKVSNIGETEARDINIKLQSEKDKNLSKEAKPSDYSQLKEIKPYESKEITFGFHPTTAGKVSLTIISSCKSIDGRTLPEKEDEVFITIRPRSQIFKPDAIINIGKMVKNFNQKNSIEAGVSYKIKTYRALCMQAFEDGKITKEEREFLDGQAKQLALTESEKKHIEDEIFRNQKVQATNFEAYRQQAIAVFRKGKITQDERGLLDVLRVNYGLTKEEQKRIEDEILNKKQEEEKPHQLQIEVADEAGIRFPGITVRVKEVPSEVDANGSPAKTDFNGIAKFTISKNKQYMASVSNLPREFINLGNIAINNAETTKRIQLFKKAGTLEVTVAERATDKSFAGIPVALMKKGASQAMDFVTDNNGKINQKLSIGEYIVRLKSSNPPLYDSIEKQVNIFENRASSVMLDFRFNYQPKSEFLSVINKINEKLNTGFQRVSTYDTCIPLFFKKVGEKPTQLVDKIIKRPAEFLGAKTSPDEIIKYILTTAEILADEISNIMREKSNVDFYSIIQNLPFVNDISVSDYSQEKFRELVLDVANYHKNHFREVGNKLNEIDYELTQLSRTLTMHPVADLWSVAQKLLENSINEPDAKKLSVMLFINDKLLDHVREMYIKEEVKASLKFSSPNEASLIINRAKKLLEEAKNLGLQMPEDKLEDAELHLSKSYACAFIKARNFEKEVENAIEELRQKAEKSITNLELGLDKLRKLSLSTQGINEVKDAYKARNYNKAAEAAAALIQKIDSLIKSSRPSLVPQLKIANFKLGAGRKTQIIIHNEGTTPATNVSSELSGDITIRVLSKLELLNPGESRPIEVWIKPTVEGDLPLNVSLKYSDGLNRNYEDKRELWIGVGETVTQLNAEASDKIEIKRGFGLLPNNDIRFGIRIKNGTGYAIMDVEILLDFNNISFSLRSDRLVNLGNLHPGGERTGKYILKPLGCIHNEQINALITYKDQTIINEIFRERRVKMKEALREKALKEFINSARTKYGDRIVRIILFGSYARGDYRKESDIDVLVIWKGDEVEGWNSLEREAVEVLFKYGFIISLKILSPNEFSAMKELDFPFIRNISQEGVVVG